MKLLILLLLITSHVFAGGCKHLPTYFRYSHDDIDDLSAMTSNEKMNANQVNYWEEIIEKLNQNHHHKTNLYRLRAYLYTAQRDAAFLSINVNKEAIGNLHPVSYSVLKLFFEDTPQSPETDLYSEKLAEVVTAKIAARLEEEKAGMKEFPLKENDEKLKNFPKPLTGLQIASWKPWILKEPTKIEMKPPSDDKKFWEEQAQLVKEELDASSEEQQQVVLFWEGKLGPGSGSWIALTNQYMNEKHVPLTKFLYIRSVLAEAGVDCDIVIYFHKYTYAKPRPWMISSEIKPIVPLASHPSYPSSHATFSAMYATILTYFFPNSEELWFRKARDAALSRVYGGLHFPIDTQEGRKLGLKIGDEILFSIKNKCF